MAWHEWCVGKNIVAAGCEHGHGGQDWKQMPWPSGRDNRRLPFSHPPTHSLTHSFHILVYLLYARHCSECWENSKNKMKSLPPRSVHPNVSIAGISHWRFSILSLPRSSAWPARKTNARPSAPSHLPGAPCPVRLPSTEEIQGFPLFPSA